MKQKLTLMEASLSSNLVIWMDLFAEARAFRSVVPELSGSRTVAKICSMSGRRANWRTIPRPMPWFVPVTNTDTILDQVEEGDVCKGASSMSPRWRLKSAGYSGIIRDSCMILWTYEMDCGVSGQDYKRDATCTFKVSFKSNTH